MEDSSFVVGLDKHSVALIDNSCYFNDSKGEGAIAYFERTYSFDMFESLEAGDPSLVMQYLNILYSAMTFCAKGNFFQKLRIPFLLMKINKATSFVRWCIENTENLLTPQQRHILMSINVRKLQILHMFYLQNICWNIRLILLNEFYDDLSYVLRAANEESIDGLHSSPSDLGPCNLVLLMCQALQYEMNVLGISDLPDSPQIKERIWLYASHNEKTHNRTIAQIVARLFRSIGHREDAEKVARRISHKDQMVKAAF